MSMQSQYIDKEGLERVVQNIKSIYARKDTLDTKEQNLYTYIDEKNQRALDEEERIEGRLDSEITRASGEEQRIEGRLDDEISRAGIREQELSDVDVSLGNRVSTLESGKVSDIIVNGNSVVTDTVANIRFDSIIAGMSIVTYDHFSDFPRPGEDNKLYIDLDTRIIYQWNGSEYKEIQDTELRADFEGYKSHHHNISQIDDISTLHLDWNNIDNAPQDFAPSHHTHTTSDITDLHLDWDSIDNKPDFNGIYYQKNETYNKEEVDDIIEHIVVPETALQDHIESLNPHPFLEERIENFVTTSLEDKADTSSLNNHLIDRENPHKVTKAQVGLENVDNTSDASKPVSVATQLELDKKVNISSIANDLETLVTNVPLSALQGAALKGLIEDARGEISSIGNPLHFKGTVSSIGELNNLTGMVQGDCWQIVEPEPEPTSEEPSSEPEEPSGEGNTENNTEEEEEVESHDGEMYAWTGTEWKQIIASVSDISAYAAKLSEIYDIINRY